VPPGGDPLHLSFLHGPPR